MFSKRWNTIPLSILAMSLLAGPVWAQGEEKKPPVPDAAKAPPAAEATPPAAEAKPPAAEARPPASEAPPPAEGAPPPADGAGATIDSEEAPTEDEKKKPETAPPPKSEWVPGTYTPTTSGLTGLFRTVTADVGGPHTFRISLHPEMFTSSGFLVKDDDNARFLGTLGISYTPFEFAEFYVNVTSMANSNKRLPEPDRLDQEVILALGDFSFGGKGMYQITNFIGVGANLGLTLLNSVGGVSVAGSATSFYIGALTTFDLDPLANFPLRFHLNVGYMLDNSSNLAEFNGYSQQSLQVEKFALGIRPSRVQIKFGIDSMLKKYLNFGLTPSLEMGVDIGTGLGDDDFWQFVESGAISEADFNGRTTMWMTVGVRTSPVRGAVAGIGVDIGLMDPGYGYGPPVIPWNLILSFGYEFDPMPRIKTVTKETIKTVVKTAAPPPSKGKLRGRVINAKTLEPVDGAVVTFPGRDLTGLSTDPDGTFLTYELPPGKLPIMVRHPDYLVGKVMTEIKVGAVVSQDIKLKPAPPKVGKLTGRVSNLKNAAVAASISISGVESKEIAADDGGLFNAELKPGSYTLHVSANGYQPKVKNVTVTAGSTISAEITISKKPRRSLVRVTKRSIIIRRKVHFATGTATIKRDSRQLLDAVVAVFLSHPNLKLVEVGGHTDNRGKKAFNQNLSQSRADSVKEYLVQNGVSSSRLVSKGYGSRKPKVPNITRRNRARNRRVEFRIKRQ